MQQAYAPTGRFGCGIDRDKLRGERLQSNAAYWCCRPDAEIAYVRLVAGKPPPKHSTSSLQASGVSPLRGNDDELRVSQV
jgi:hypothetical protein